MPTAVYGVLVILVAVLIAVGGFMLVQRLVPSFIRQQHNDVAGFIYPGIPPTGRRVEIPVIVVVMFRDGKIASEHIYWDQASPSITSTSTATPRRHPVRRFFKGTTRWTSLIPKRLRALIIRMPMPAPK